jgi:hypothetical protein
MTLVALAEARLTLLDASIFLSRPEFRRAVLRHVSIPEVREYWTLRFERISPSQRVLITESVLNKLSVFQDPAVKYVVGQQDGALNFDRALAEGQIILGNISSGALRGNTFLLAALLTASFRNAVYRRPAVASPYGAILDEFQEMIAIEALDDYLRSFRKSRVSVYLGTQTLQLPPELRSSIFGNCSRFFAFATSAADASALTKEFGGQEAPLVGERLPELRTGQALVKVRGESVRLLRVAAPDCEPTLQRVEEGRSLCLRLGASREQIDKEIEQRRNRFMSNAASANRDAEDVRKDHGTAELPEGYEGY